MEGDELPNQALYFVLPYLPLHQLLLMSQVCKSLRDAVRDDVLVWLDIVVESPLNLRLTDQILINITSKANGRLRTLALLKCEKISDDALLQVVTANPFLTKLYVPDCTCLTPEGILRAVKTLTANTNAFSCLKINGINIKKENLLTLQYYIPPTTNTKSRFYHKYRKLSFYSIDKDDRSIDVEICPQCEEVKLVFDCPTETDCKGCLQCIPRCESCGKCNSKEDDDEQGETICDDNVCLECWLRLPKCNHCNRPFCPRHATNQVYSLGSQGFICEGCHAKSQGTCWQE